MVRAATSRTRRLVLSGTAPSRVRESLWEKKEKTPRVPGVDPVRTREKWGGQPPSGYSEGSEQNMEDGGKQDDSTKLWEKKKNCES